MATPQGGGRGGGGGHLPQMPHPGSAIDVQWIWVSETDLVCETFGVCSPYYALSILGSIADRTTVRNSLS